MEHYKNLDFKDIEGEIWMPIPNYNGLYECSNLGRIKCLSKTVRGVRNGCDNKRVLTPKIKKQFLSVSGYCNFFLNNNNKKENVRTHRLVANIFINGETEERAYVNHKNVIKTDNTVQNLEWVSFKENMEHASANGRCKGTVYFGKENIRSKKVNQYDLNGNFVNSFYGTKEAERMTGISHKLIGRVCLFKRSYTKGFIWRYV